MRSGLAALPAVWGAKGWTARAVREVACLCLVARAITSLVVAGCAAIHDGQGEQSMPAVPIEQVLKDNTDELMAIRGVVGTGQGRCGQRDCIQVYVVEITPELKAKIPKVLEGYPVETEAMGEPKALPRDEEN